MDFFILRKVRARLLLISFAVTKKRPRQTPSAPVSPRQTPSAFVSSRQPSSALVTPVSPCQPSSALVNLRQPSSALVSECLPTPTSSPVWNKEQSGQRQGGNDGRQGVTGTLVLLSSPSLLLVVIIVLLLIVDFCCWLPDITFIIVMWKRELIRYGVFPSAIACSMVFSRIIKRNGSSSLIHSEDRHFGKCKNSPKFETVSD